MAPRMASATWVTRARAGVLACIVAGASLLGCGDNVCTEAEAHIQECLGSDVSKEVSDEECKGLAEQEAECYLDLSCEEILNNKLEDCSF